MKRELSYFRIGRAYGGSQGWFRDPMMRLGGCGAATACDICIYLAVHRGLPALYPYDAARLNRRDYVRFSGIMKPYLRPRRSGIDRLDLFTDGFASYLNDLYAPKGTELSEAAEPSKVSETAKTADGSGPQQCPLAFREIPGTALFAEAETAVRRQIDDDMPVAYLLLRHQDPALKEYVWHWFLLTGYETTGGAMRVKAVTYGAWEWIDFAKLWDTGDDLRGGMVLPYLCGPHDSARRNEKKKILEEK